MTETPFNVVKREDLVPVCPHCDRQVPEVYARTQGVAFVTGQHLVYFCPHCSKVLGFGQGRMI